MYYHEMGTFVSINYIESITKVPILCLVTITYLTHRHCTYHELILMSFDYIILLYYNYVTHKSILE